MSNGIQNPIAEMLKAKSKRSRSNKELLPPTGRNYPKELERRYQREILTLMNQMYSIIKEELKVVLPSIKRLAAQELGLRQDAYDDDISSFFQRLKIKIFGEIPDSAVERIAERQSLRVNAKNTAVIRSQYKSVVGIDLFTTEPFLRPKLGAFVKENTRLIKDMRDSTLTKLEGTITRGVESGKSLRDITGEVQDTLKVNTNRARLIARDQTATLNGQLTRLRQENAGIKRYKWSTARDNLVRDSHEKLDGEVFSWSSPPKEGHPGQDINCRCVAIPVFSSLE